MAVQRSADIHLRNRRLTPRPGVAAALIRRARSVGTATVHAIVQPAEQVDPATRRRWVREHGIRLLDPVPEGAFLAAVPADADALRALVGRDRPLRWAGALEARDKLSPRLVGGVPEHARGEAGARVVVLFFGDVPVRTQEQVLRPHALDRPRRVEPVNGWLAEVAEDALPRLCDEDAVKWVEEVPPPIELDNDGVRGGTAGVQADLVHAAPYGLTGSGVVVGQWETRHASLTHADYAARIVLADGPLLVAERTALHADPDGDGAYDVGEAIYVDLDDSATVTAGDHRVTAVGPFLAGSTVGGADSDVGTGLVPFADGERFADGNGDGWFAPGDAIYLDADDSNDVSAGDVRLTDANGFPAGSVVAAADSDAGTALDPFGDPHYHATHVAGTVVGDGTASAAEGGTPNQWKGVAPGATLRSYSVAGALDVEYVDAAAGGVKISTNSWGFTHMHEVATVEESYDVTTALYDAVVSGLRSDGTPSGLAAPVLVVGSAGNAGQPERHAENSALNNLFDVGEAVYLDANDSGAVSASGDVLLTGPAQAVGTALVDFRLDECHDETGSVDGVYEGGEAIYRDLDGSGTVTPGDLRLTVAGAFAAGTTVASGDADEDTPLRSFRMWRTLRVPNCAKDTVVVANVRSDTAVPSPTSSRGPTLDGRIKPDVAGPGSEAGGDLGVTSTQPRDSYDVLTGTSMATPAVSGVLALMTERYRQLCGGADPPPHALRALLVHAAEDLATIPNVGSAFAGPDYSHGWGRTRAKQAVDLIPHHLQATAAALGDTDYPFTIGAVEGLKVTLVWDDPAWTASASPSPTTGLLQNDLDLVLVAPDGTQHTPWLLDPADPAMPATRSSFASGVAIPESARDRRNTVEQVVVAAAAAGTWTIRVTAAMLNVGAQPYTLVCEFVPPQDSPCAAAPAVDVWMRDNAADVGTVPSAGTMYHSPDVWNRLAADGGGGGVHENPEFGQTNHLYGTLRNASAGTALAVSVDFWLAPAGTGLAWPALFSYVGRIVVPNMPPGVQTIGPLEWLPPDPDPSDHFCFYVRITSPQDPVTFAETATLHTNVSNSNNLVWRNINVVDDIVTAAFMVTNVSGARADVEIVVRTPAEVLESLDVGIRLPAAFEQRLGAVLRDVPGLGRPAAMDAARFVLAAREDREAERAVGPAPRRAVVAPEVRLPAVRLEPFEGHAMTVTFGAVDRLAGEHTVEVEQVVDGEVVGGIRYVVRGRAKGGLLRRRRGA